MVLPVSISVKICTKLCNCTAEAVKERHLSKEMLLIPLDLTV